MQTERRTWGRYLLGSLLHTGLETRVVRAQDADARNRSADRGGRRR